MLGNTIPRDAVVPERDAIHIAVMPVTLMSDYASPGEPVDFVVGTKDQVVRVYAEYGHNAVGVLDPFVVFSGKNGWSFKQGDRVWLYLYPNTVTGMRHHWQHPIVDAPPTQESESETWLRRYAQEGGFMYKEMVEAAIAGNDYITSYGQDTEYGADRSDFWHHIEVVAGKAFDRAHKESVGWSCSC